MFFNIQGLFILLWLFLFHCILFFYNEISFQISRRTVADFFLSVSCLYSFLWVTLVSGSIYLDALTILHNILSCLYFRMRQWNTNLFFFFFFLHVDGAYWLHLYVVGDLALPITCCVILGKLINHSVLQVLLELWTLN